MRILLLKARATSSVVMLRYLMSAWATSRTALVWNLVISFAMVTDEITTAAPSSGQFSAIPGK
jgi:hypothetical protein